MTDQRASGVPTWEASAKTPRVPLVETLREAGTARDTGWSPTAWRSGATAAQVSGVATVADEVR